MSDKNTSERKAKLKEAGHLLLTECSRRGVVSGIIAGLLRIIIMKADEPIAWKDVVIAIWWGLGVGVLIPILVFTIGIMVGVFRVIKRKKEEK